jgi:hypothetical protein
MSSTLCWSVRAVACGTAVAAETAVVPSRHTAAAATATGVGDTARQTVELVPFGSFPLTLAQSLATEMQRRFPQSIRIAVAPPFQDSKPITGQTQTFSEDRLRNA